MRDSVRVGGGPSLRSRRRSCRVSVGFASALFALDASTPSSARLASFRDSSVECSSPMDAGGTGRMVSWAGSCREISGSAAVAIPSVRRASSIATSAENSCRGVSRDRGVACSMIGRSGGDVGKGGVDSKLRWTSVDAVSDDPDGASYAARSASQAGHVTASAGTTAPQFPHRRSSAALAVISHSSGRFPAPVLYTCMYDKR